MPDTKYSSREVADKYSQAPDYWAVNKACLVVMQHQVGDLVIDQQGIARKGLLIRHLVLPSGLAGTRQVMQFIAEKISTNTYVNIMPQYRPCGRADEIEELSAHLSQKDFTTALEEAIAEGIERHDSRRRRFILW